MAKILEEAENLAGERMATFVTERGVEGVVNLDVALLMLLDAVCEETHEREMGWTLNSAWYQDKFKSFRAAITRADGGGA